MFISGVNAIIDRLQYIRDINPRKNYAHFATITSVDDGDEELPYHTAQRCMVLAETELANYMSIVLLDMEAEGYIKELLISTNPRYHFQIEEGMSP